MVSVFGAAAAGAAPDPPASTGAADRDGAGGAQAHMVSRRSTAAARRARTASRDRRRDVLAPVCLHPGFTGKALIIFMLLAPAATANHSARLRERQSRIAAADGQAPESWTWPTSAVHGRLARSGKARYPVG